MSSSAKKTKRSNRGDSGTDEPVELESSPSKSSTSKKSLSLCIICGGSSSENITRDQNYNAIMQLYWCTLGVDVKPEACQKQDTCKKCFMKLVEFFETNDIIVYFETYFKSLRLNLLRSTLKATAEWTKAGHTLTKPQLEVKQKYDEGLDITAPEEEQIRQTLSEYEMESYDILDDDDSEKGGPRTGIKLTKKSYPEAEKKRPTPKTASAKKPVGGDSSDSD